MIALLRLGAATTVALAAILAPAASVFAQEIVQDRRLPVLLGHRFIPTSTVPDPFITSWTPTPTSARRS